MLGTKEHPGLNFRCPRCNHLLDRIKEVAVSIRSDICVRVSLRVKVNDNIG